MKLPENIVETLGLVAYTIYANQPYIVANLHLILSAVLPIYAGSYSSLSRPSSAAKRPKKKSKDKTDSDEEDDDEVVQRMEGLAPSDAIVFPIMAGLTLTGLYFIIKWLQNPDLLNKILNWYFAIFSVLSVARMVSDILDVAHSMIFPHEYRDRNVLFHVDGKSRRALPVTIAPATEIRTSPLPGIFSRIPLSRGLTNYLWKDRVLPYQKWTLTAIVGPIVSTQLKLGIHGLGGIVVGLATVLYYNFIGKPWFLTNIMGFAFAYGALQLMSPTTFGTGSLILIALFFYDIYFVFYTPMMVTVAKSLDIPIKLLIPKPADPDLPDEPPGLSMLGLGDVVLPGLVIGLALRFDLFLFYLRKQKRMTPQEVKAAKAMNDPAQAIEEETDPIVGDETHAATSTKSEGSLTDQHDAASKDERKDEQLVIIKAPYSPVHTGWGDLFWTSKILPSFLSLRTTRQNPAEDYSPRNVFPKPYFRAALTGYVVGLLVTLAVMNITNHPQPALLYLVPGVVGSIWLTALVRGEIKLAWAFSDAGEEEDQDQDKPKDNEKDNAEENQPKKDEKAGEDNKSSKALEKQKSSTSSSIGGFFSLKRHEQREKTSEALMRKYVSEAPDYTNSSEDGSSSSSSEKEDDERKKDKSTRTKSGKKSRSKKKEKKGKTLFLISITSPPPAYPDMDTEADDKDKEDSTTENGKADNGKKSGVKDAKVERSWRASNGSGSSGVGVSGTRRDEDEEHADKRLRVK